MLIKRTTHQLTHKLLGARATDREDNATWEKIETLHQISESEQFIVFVTATVEGAKHQTITGNFFSAGMDLAGTLPQRFPDATGSDAEAQKPALPNDAS